jgi:hypothetical protein
VSFLEIEISGLQVFHVAYRDAALLATVFDPMPARDSRQYKRSQELAANQLEMASFSQNRQDV